MMLGVMGWQWPDWEGAFYPQDMPVEWRLTYFNTQFDCLFLPAGQWQTLPESEFAAWAGDCHEQFLFLLEGGPGQNVPAPLRGRAIVLASDDPAIVWFKADTDLKTLAARIRSRNSQATYVISRDGALGQIERVRTLLELLG